MRKVNWEKASKKKISEEFRSLLQNMGHGNGVNDLIDVVEGIPNIDEKRSFVVSWHEQDESDESG